MVQSSGGGHYVNRNTVGKKCRSWYSDLEVLENMDGIDCSYDGMKKYNGGGFGL